MTAKVKRGQIYYADLSPCIGSEQGGLRPVLIVSNDVGNKHSPVVIICPITSRVKNPLPTHMTMLRNHRNIEGTVLCEQTRTIDKRRLKEFMCCVTEDEMARVDKALAIALGLC